jgi:hypothetical protein
MTGAQQKNSRGPQNLGARGNFPPSRRPCVWHFVAFDLYKFMTTVVRRINTPDSCGEDDYWISGFEVASVNTVDCRNINICGKNLKQKLTKIEIQFPLVV